MKHSLGTVRIIVGLSLALALFLWYEAPGPGQPTLGEVEIYVGVVGSLVLSGKWMRSRASKLHASG
jgi:hypothetical protein